MLGGGAGRRPSGVWRASRGGLGHNARLPRPPVTSLTSAERAPRRCAGAPPPIGPHHVALTRVSPSGNTTPASYDSGRLVPGAMRRHPDDDAESKIGRAHV